MAHFSFYWLKHYKDLPDEHKLVKGQWNKKGEVDIDWVERKHLRFGGYEPAENEMGLSVMIPFWVSPNGTVYYYDDLKALKEKGIEGGSGGDDTDRDTTRTDYAHNNDWQKYIASNNPVVDQYPVTANVVTSPLEGTDKEWATEHIKEKVKSDEPQYIEDARCRGMEVRLNVRLTKDHKPYSTYQEVLYRGKPGREYVVINYQGNITTTGKLEGKHWKSGDPKKTKYKCDTDDNKHGGTGAASYGGAGAASYGGTGAASYGGAGVASYGGTGGPSYGCDCKCDDKEPQEKEDRSDRANDKNASFYKKEVTEKPKEEVTKKPENEIKKHKEEVANSPAVDVKHPKWQYLNNSDDDFLPLPPDSAKEFKCGDSPNNSLDSLQYDTYFDENGKILKVVYKGSGRAILVSRNGAQKVLELTNKELIDRAHWVYGEGGGAFADRYANTIKNLRNAGKSGYGTKPFESDEAMYKAAMTHKVGNTIRHLYPDYFNPGVNENGRVFAAARHNCRDLMNNSTMVSCIKAVIDSLIEKSVNEGYTEWRGSGDRLYTEDEVKRIQEIEYGKDTELKTKAGKVYALVKVIIHHFFEKLANGKYRRHTFRKQWLVKV
jgi:hypothetical protein